jgi:Fe-S oxidoreductase
MMTDDANVDRIKKRMESLMDDIKELANIAAECPTCSMRFKEYLQSKQ